MGYLELKIEKLLNLDLKIILKVLKIKKVFIQITFKNMI